MSFADDFGYTIETNLPMLPRVSDPTPGVFAGAQPSAQHPGKIAVRTEAIKGTGRRLGVTATLDRRQAGKLLMELARALGTTDHTQDELVVDAFRQRAIDGGAMLDGIQDAREGER